MADQDFTPSSVDIVNIKEYQAKLSTMLKHVLSEDWL